MTVKQVLKKLEALGDEKRRAHNAKYGASDKQFGVKMGDIRALAKELKSQPDLALALWETENVDAQFLAVLMMKPKALTEDDLDRLVRSSSFVQVTDWLSAYVIKKHPDKESLRQRWMEDEDPKAARAGWTLTAERVVKSPDGLELKSLLDRIESEMGDADPDIQWTMNIALGETGIQFPKHRKRALKIGETLGGFRDYPHIEGLHLTLRADLDQRDGEAAGLIGSRRSLAVAGDRPNLSSCLEDLLDDLQAVGPLRVGDRLGLALQLTDPDAYDGLSVHRPSFRRDLS